MAKEIRIVSISGKYALRWCVTDVDNYVEQVLDEVDIKFKSLDEMKALILGIQAAQYAGITCVNAGNRAELIKSDWRED